MNPNDVRNLSFSYYQELLYWNNVWNDKHPEIQDRLNPEKRYAIPSHLIELVDLIRKTGIHPRVLDCGCGPFSNLTYLSKAGLADLVGADPLADEYMELYRRWNIPPPLPIIRSSGETLTVDKCGGQFDIVYIQNALDHHAAPAAAWYNLFKLVKPNGYLAHSHGVREADYQKQLQLHQYNLFPSDKQDLMIDDLHGDCFSLTDGLPLKLHFSKILPIRENYDYFVQIWQKTGEEITSMAYYEHMYQHLLKVHVKRSNWAFFLECNLNRAANLESIYKLPYFVNPKTKP